MEGFNLFSHYCDADWVDSDLIVLAKKSAGYHDNKNFEYKVRNFAHDDPSSLPALNCPSKMSKLNLPGQETSQEGGQKALNDCKKDTEA